jgi:hypothetical protein
MSGRRQNTQKCQGNNPRVRGEALILRVKRHTWGIDHRWGVYPPNIPLGLMPPDDILRFAPAKATKGTKDIREL